MMEERARARLVTSQQGEGKSCKGVGQQLCAEEDTQNASGDENFVGRRNTIIRGATTYVTRRQVQRGGAGSNMDERATWIQRSTSEYASPVLLVAKKDGSKRLCCDYRRLNEKIVRDNFPMPLIDDVVERLHAPNVFATLNLTNGFFHVPVEASSRKYTSFVTHNEQYEFLYVPFGISNSPAVFSRFIFAVFRDMIQNGTRRRLHGRPHHSRQGDQRGSPKGGSRFWATLYKRVLSGHLRLRRGRSKTFQYHRIVRLCNGFWA
ncbi:PREDICTED: uncharacterized protein LOC108365767 [Rhagoletis zephyria]|uniref:uncharacterized protein LOC108365767 n=1 Tax=Rhagoletis zephyria TaxID=28612 RepID=UPI000811960E|nr:PREDICTED: uncharacterized protein LOC108365767 [Rhagoletis zephyria]